jgi:hypothetical protein
MTEFPVIYSLYLKNIRISGVYLATTVDCGNMGSGTAVLSYDDMGDHERR